MNLSQTVFEALQADADLVALVGSRIWSGVLPYGGTDPVGPWLVFTRISNNQEAAHDGDQHFTRARYQITVGSSEKERVDAVRDIIVSNFNGVEFESSEGQAVTIFHADDHEHYEHDARTYSAIIDLQILALT